MSEKFVHAVLNHAYGCSTSSRSLSRSNSGCSTSSGASTSNSCISESPKLVRVVDHDADKAKPLIIDEWHYIFDNIGREFMGGVKDVRIAVDQYKMCTGYKIVILKNDKTRFTAKCENDGCGFGLRLKSPAVTTKLLKHLIADNIQGDPTLKLKQIMSLFKKTYGSNIKYRHAHRGKEDVFEDQYGDDKKSYNDLNWYVKAIEKTNPDSFVKLEVDQETGRFQRIFVCFGSCKHIYRYLRPMIYLDATFLTGRFRSTLMVATCINGNDGFYPYAFAIVLYENKENWFLFLDNLKQVVDGRPIVFLSDRHEGLLQGIPRVFPGSYHSYCFYHIKCNLPVGKGDANYNAVIDLFYKAAYSYTSTNFEEALRGMHAIGCGHVANYLKAIPKEKWENSFFPVCRYAAHSSTLSESFNNWILELKKLSSFALLVAIRLKVMQMNSKRRVEGQENFNTRLIPVYEDILNENIKIGRTWTVVESMERLYEVRSPRTHSVDLLERNLIIFPIPNYDKPQSYDPSDRIIVPILVPPPGRQREQCFKKAWEKQKRPMMCKKCFTLDHHNRATFPMP
ncbi:uncharacterized protein LOC113290589 [Papaver somniferum]|uniref:uncharacterized protein LOC113290589 n=1 Tax=Papaver somniferum TaxID=3469 RepID=UPI000E6FE1AD|nr:uncharacterized protein LOC113290589 [Papaver somniferum]